MREAEIVEELDADRRRERGQVAIPCHLLKPAEFIVGEDGRLALAALVLLRRFSCRHVCSSLRPRPLWCSNGCGSGIVAVALINTPSISSRVIGPPLVARSARARGIELAKAHFMERPPVGDLEVLRIALDRHLAGGRGGGV